MCYRAIKAQGGKATLQDICGWMRDTFDWYKWNDEAGWEVRCVSSVGKSDTDAEVQNSVRHNLSSNRAFRKMERCAGERGKGFFWSIEEKSIPSFEEQEARLEVIQQQQANGSMSVHNGIKVTAGKSKKGGAALSDPPLKRSVKSGPLPPPLTNTPLAMKSALIPSPGSLASPYPQLHLPPHLQPNPGTTNGTVSTITTPSVTTPNPYIPSPPPPPPPPPTQSGSTPASSIEAANTVAAQSTSFISSLPPSVCIPIVIGSVPSASSSNSSPPSTSSSPTHLSTPPIVLHDNTLILNPSVFSHLTPEQLKELEALGAQKALEILQSYIVRFLKERIRGEKDGSRGGRGRGRGRPKRGGRRGTSGSTSGTGLSPSSGPFTMTPLPHPNGIAGVRKPESGSAMQTQRHNSMNGLGSSAVNSQPPVPVPMRTPDATTSPAPPKPIPIPIPLPAPPKGPGHTSESPIIIVDDVDEDECEGPAFKKRRLNGEGGAVAS